MNLNPFTHIRYYIYLLQLENYYISRFFTVSTKSLFHARKDLRLGIVWTHKLRAVTGIAALMSVALVLFPFLLPTLGWIPTVLLLVLMFLVSSYFFFVLLGIVVFLTLPVDRYLKKRIVEKARTKIQSMPDLQVIGITGSYGKTTMKEVISAALSRKYNVLKTEENKNTPLGISRQILSQLNDSTDIYVVEMGAYERGDIRELVELVSPSIVVLVGINEAHLERQGSIENIIETKFEIVKHAPRGAYVVLNYDDKNVRDNAKRFIRPDEEVVWFGRMGGDIVAKKVVPDTDGMISFNLVGKEEYGNFSTQFLASYIAVNGAAAFIVSQKLGVSVGALKAAMNEIRPAPHRLSPSESGGILFIDDAYNGNPAGVEEAIHVLSRYSSRRKIYVTPGLVEMGERRREVHEKMGKDLSAVADIVVLIKNEATQIVKETLMKEGFSEDNIMMFSTAPEAHEALRHELKKGDVVLFQNDAAENYL